MEIPVLHNIFVNKLFSNRISVQFFTYLWMLFGILFAVFYYGVFKFGHYGYICNVVLFEVCLLILLIGINNKKIGCLKTFTIFCLVILVIHMINVIVFFFKNLSTYANSNDKKQIESFKKSLKDSLLELDYDNYSDERISHMIRIKTMAYTALNIGSTIIMIFYYFNSCHYANKLVESLERDNTIMNMEKGYKLNF